MAQTTRAVLLAIATRTTLVGLRASKACTQPDRSSLRALVQRRTARAPWTSNRLRYLSPRFDIRPSRSLPPLEFCLGTRPSQAASCRPDWNCDASPIIATSDQSNSRNCFQPATCFICAMPGLQLLFKSTGKYAFRWTRRSCKKFRDNEARLQLHALAYNLATFLRCIKLPEAMADWSLTSLQLKLIKIGARVVRHARAITLQLAEVAVTGPMVRTILAAIRRLRGPPICA